MHEDIFALTANYGWSVVTQLGSLSLLLPILLLQCVALRSSRPQLVRNWLLAFGLGAGLTLCSKFLFIGWGLGSETLDFTGISGHAVFASSMYPVMFTLYSPQGHLALRKGAFGLGFALAVAVAVSRVVMGAHSMSEVVAGTAVGLVVSLAALSAFRVAPAGSWVTRFAPLLVLLLALDPVASQFLPTHSWEVKLALWVSGHERPFTRQYLHPHRQIALKAI
jgi:membrane-associated phospholipid phosphatase